MDFELLSINSCIHLVLSYLITEVISNDWPRESYHMFTPDTLGFNKIYVINLNRRPERRQRLEQIADKLKIDLTFFKAKDGRKLQQIDLDQQGVSVLPHDITSFFKRPMTYGEIGCSLSHYAVWEDMLRNQYQKVLILEDDVLFFPMFRKKISRYLADVEEYLPNWDLIYLGRKTLLGITEKCVNGTDFLVWPNYSHWTLAYALSKNGAKKLTNRNYLKQLVPIDEYFPILYDKHPGETLMKYFEPRDLVAVSTLPLLTEPAWFPEDVGYTTDTDNISFQ